MKLGWHPKTKDDWHLLLRLVKLVRLSTRDDLALMVAYGESRQHYADTTLGLVHVEAPDADGNSTAREPAVVYRAHRRRSRV